MGRIRAVVLHEGDLGREDWDDPVRGRLGFFTVFSAGTTPTGAMTAGVAVLPPGGWLGAHRHEPAEIYHVLEGQGVVRLDGWDHELGVGSSVFIPGDLEHGIRNAGTASLRFFYTFAVDSFDEVEYHFPGGG